MDLSIPAAPLYCAGVVLHDSYLRTRHSNQAPESASTLWLLWLNQKIMWAGEKHVILYTIAFSSKCQQERIIPTRHSTFFVYFITVPSHDFVCWQWDWQMYWLSDWQWDRHWDMKSYDSCTSTCARDLHRSNWLDEQMLMSSCHSSAYPNLMRSTMDISL